MCSWSTLNAQNALLWHEHTPRDVCATHPLRHQWHFDTSHARPSSDAASVHGCHEFDECRKCFRACIYAKEVHFNTYCDSRVYTQLMFIWLILSTISLNSDIVLHTLEFCYFWYCFSQDSVAIHRRCGGKYDTDLVANLPLSITVREFLRSVNVFQSYERISSGTCFMAHGVVFWHGISHGSSVETVRARPWNDE